MRTPIWVLVLILASGLLAVGENKLMWGYWVERPSVARSLGDIDGVFGVSALPLGSAWQEPRGRASQRAERGYCRTPSNECPERRLLLALGGREAGITEVRDGLLGEVWSEETSRNPVPVPKDPAYERSARPVTGLAVHLRSEGREFVALAYRTSEVANDRYIYSEALYRLGQRGLELVRHERFSYEIAGFEAIDWRVLWALNLACLVACVSLAALIRRRTRRGPVGLSAAG